MADHEGPGTPRQITINANDELARGRYSNNMLVAHTEFHPFGILKTPFDIVPNAVF